MKTRNQIIFDLFVGFQQVPLINNISQHDQDFFLSDANENNIVVIDYKEDYNLYVLCFHKCIVFIIKQNLKAILCNDANKHKIQNLNFYFCSDEVNNQFITDTGIKKTIENRHLKTEIYNFCNEIRFSIKKTCINDNFEQEIKERFLNKEKNLWNLVKNAFIGYIIKEGYYNTRMKRYQSNRNFLEPFKYQSFDINDFISINSLTTFSNTINRCYNVNNREIVIMKLINQKDEYSLKHYRREKKCYESLKIQHHHRPQYFGEIKNNYGLVLEFIEGEVLKRSEVKQFTVAEKISIIFNIMVSIEDLHLNSFLYRDLKPNNIVIDVNKEAVLIDFDFTRKENPDNNNYTTGFGEEYYTSPEQCSSKYSYETDIYAIGKIIYFITQDKNIKKNNEFKNLKWMESIYNKCINKEPSERPNISQLINEFYEKCLENCKETLFFDKFEKDKDKETIMNTLIELSNIRIKQIQSFVELDNNNDSKKHLINKILLIFDFLSNSYYTNCDDILKSFFPEIVSFASKYDVDWQSLFLIGKVYYEGRYVQKDSQKAEHYFKCSENKNESMFRLVKENYLSQNHFKLPIDIKELQSNKSEIKSTNKVKLPSMNEIKEINTNEPKLPNTNEPKLPNINEPKLPNTNEPKLPNTNEPKLPNTNEPKLPNTNEIQQPNINEPKQPNINEPKQPNINEIKQPNINEIQQPNTNEIQQPNINEIQQPNINETMKQNESVIEKRNKFEIQQTHKPESSKYKESNFEIMHQDSIEEDQNPKSSVKSRLPKNDLSNKICHLFPEASPFPLQVPFPFVTSTSQFQPHNKLNDNEVNQGDEKKNFQPNSSEQQAQLKDPLHLCQHHLPPAHSPFPDHAPFPF